MTPTRFEVWELRKPRPGAYTGRRGSRWLYIGSNLPSALAVVPWRRRRLRVREFYDRHLRCRIVQFLAGDGWAVR